MIYFQNMNIFILDFIVWIFYIPFLSKSLQIIWTSDALKMGSILSLCWNACHSEFSGNHWEPMENVSKFRWNPYICYISLCKCVFPLSHQQTRAPSRFTRRLSSCCASLWLCAREFSLNGWSKLPICLSDRNFPGALLLPPLNHFPKEGWALATRGRMVSEVECTKASCNCFCLTGNRSNIAILSYKWQGNWRVREAWTGTFTALKPAVFTTPNFLRKDGPWNAHCDKQLTSGKGIHEPLAGIIKLTHIHEKP